MMNSKMGWMESLLRALRVSTLTLAISLIGISGCAAQRPIEVPLDQLMPAKLEPPELKPVEIVEVPKVLPMPSQLKPLAASAVGTNKIIGAAVEQDPERRIVRANAAARVEPSLQNFINATQQWPYSPDALYQVYASPERITDIALQEGEELVSVSAGDTVRWVIGDTTSGGVTDQRVHILVKPTREELKTNLIINTNRRTYHLELTSTANTWLASVAWNYPLDRLGILKANNARAEVMAPTVEGLALDRLNFRYDISGDAPAWKPVRAFDDGEKVYIQFPNGIGQGELPPLFVVGAKGDAQLVNYRVRTPYYIVDRLFSVAELRLGGDKDAQAVRISRINSKDNKSAAR